MAGVTYTANTGIDFEALKPPVRVEKGGMIPDSLSQEEIAELLAIDAISEAVPMPASSLRKSTQKAEKA